MKGSFGFGTHLVLVHLARPSFFERASLDVDDRSFARPATRMSGTTGAAFGRAGGRLSGGSRAQKALRATARVKFIGPASTDGHRRSSSGGSTAPPRASQAGMSATMHLDGLEALSVLAEQAAAAAAAAAEAYAAAQKNQSGSANQAQGAPPPKSAAKAKRALAAARTPSTNQKKSKAGGGLPSEVKRGEQFVIQVTSRNAANNDYTWEDVCELGARIKAKEVKVSRCDNVDENGDRIYKVPKSSMQRWCVSDDDVADCT